MPIAITHDVSSDLRNGERTHLARQNIDFEKARRQHDQYERALAELGCTVRRLPGVRGLPDSVFVEDTAVVLDELAIVSRPGAVSRRGETAVIADVLAEYRSVHEIISPGTLDGGDVLRVGKRIYVGISGRTNVSGITQLTELVSPYDYEVVRIRTEGCLHLKSAVTQVGEDVLLVNRSWIDTEPFEGMDLMDIDPSEQYAANALFVGGRLVYPASFPGTRKRLEERGFSVRAVDVSELQKAEGAVTCCSLIFRDESKLIN